MIVVLNVYRIKFENAEKALAIWREGLTVSRLFGSSEIEVRLLTDSMGTYFTIMVEVTAESLEAYEKWTRDVLGNREYGDWHRRFDSLAVGRYKEVFSVVDQTSHANHLMKSWAHVAD